MNDGLEPLSQVPGTSPADHAAKNWRDHLRGQSQHASECTPEQKADVRISGLQELLNAADLPELVTRNQGVRSFHDRLGLVLRGHGAIALSSQSRPHEL